MNDPIADMLTRIRNAQAVMLETVEIPYSNLKYKIAKILEEKGFVIQVKKVNTTVTRYTTIQDEINNKKKQEKQEKLKIGNNKDFNNKDNKDNKDNKIIIILKYKNKLPVIRELKRISKLGKRIYIKAKNIKLIKRGYGFFILSTSSGIMDSKSAKKKNIGGEVICEVS